MRDRLIVLSLGLLVALSALPGCGSPLVGLECRDGYERCGGGCYDLVSDRTHCGQCGITCSETEQCVMSMCVPGMSQPDAGDDAGADGGMDGGDLDSGRDAGNEAEAGANDGAANDAARDGAVTDGAASDGAVTDGGANDGGANDGGANDGAANDGAVDDGGANDGAVDDGSVDDGGPDDDASTPPDASLPPVRCSGPGSPSDCVCDQIGEGICNLECFNVLTDHDHCGVSCATCAADEFCAAGTCDLICELPLFLCDGICVDRTNDVRYCGSGGPGQCGLVCPPGAACIDGACVGRSVGHVVVIGHDMSATRPPMVTLFGNAVFLPNRNPVRVLIYDERTSAASRNGVLSALQAVSLNRGRAFTLTTAQETLVPAQLLDTDVFIIESQHQADDALLQGLGEQWGGALHDFLFRGGVIVLFDAGGTHGGTYRILRFARRTTPLSDSVWDALARVPLTPRHRMRLATPTDALAGSVPTEYQAEGESAGFQFDGDVGYPPRGAIVIQDTDVDAGLLPIVIHETVTD